MKEITVTFENGAVFNGAANSLTLDNVSTFYFHADLYYRVQVDLETLAILLQEYQNTNGAWYGIDTITQVAVTEIKAEGDVTKDYLEQNYYNKQQTNNQIKDTLQDYYTKQQVDDLIAQGGGGEVTKDYLDQNYYNKAQVDQIAGRFYNKTESDGRYVHKAGDTMTGPLIITNSEGYKAKFEANSWTIYNTEDIATLNLYNNNVNLYNSGGVYIKQGTTGSASLIRMTVNGFYIYDPDGEWVGSLAQENNYAICALHMFNNSRIAMHSGKPNTTERFLQINNSEFHLYNNVDYGAFHFYGPTVVEDKLTVQGQLNANGRTNHRGDIYIYDRWLYQYQSNKCTVQISNEIHIYNGARLVLHSGAKDTAEETTNITYSGLSKYYPTGNRAGFNINVGEGALYLTSTIYNGTGVRINCPNGHYTLTDGSQSVTGTGLYRTVNDTYYSYNMLNALNTFLEYLQNNIKSAVTTFNKVSIIDFDPLNWGSDGKARGGHIGGNVG